MAESYDLTKLDANSFEHLVNLLALHVLGAGHTGFGPGSDGGRDGYYEGEAPYPSETERWLGRWYIQSKFHKPHLSKDPQKWLIEQIQKEIKEFERSDARRQWPDNWIVATNIDPSGSPETGAFDRARKLVSKSRPNLKNHFHIWGGCKILDLLTLHPQASQYYRHFLTPGHILTAIYDQMKDAKAEVETILRYLIVKQFDEQQYTKLEQAGSTADARPGIHRLFIDLPFQANEYHLGGFVTEFLVRAAAKCHRIDLKQLDTKEWRLWSRHPSRSRVWFVKGGPGQGKSTIGQYFCQIQRASLILQDDGPFVKPQQRTTAREIRQAAEKASFWPAVPRIPISVELKEFAQWFGQRERRLPRGILSYLAECISASVEQEVLVGTLKRALQSRSWFIVFDGLDEVPHDVKDAVASEVCNFVDNIVLECNADLLTLCTSRPQGYSGQFSDMDGPTIELVNLSPEQALQCAKPVIELGRSAGEARKALETLASAVQSSSVRELMTTPLQAHIMAVVVRGGGKPPDRRWQLFTNFYQVIKTREANRDLPDKRLAKLLREDEQLLRTVHNRLGFLLHSRAETSKGAQTNLDRAEFRMLVANAVSQMVEREVDDTINVLMEATTDRLVLVSTPDDGNHVRFDIRSLQEFFAAEFLYESIDAEELSRRIELVAGDAHWREVMHFLMSALVENGRGSELSVAIQVLEHLNEGDGDPQSRLLSRRLGRGALLAARLLQEGVLEQDKRIRQQFRKCLEPLAGFMEVEALRPLILVGQPNSESWLINFLVESLREANPTESIGAAIVLAHILPDGHQHEEEVKDFFLAAPPAYISVVLASMTSSRHSEERPSTILTHWFLDITLKLLLRPQWLSLGTTGFNSAIDILRQDKQVSEKIARENGLLSNQIELLLGLLKDNYGGSTGTQDQKYGFLVCGHFEHDWTTNIFSFGSWSDELPNDISDSPGIFQLVYRIIKFGKTRCLADLYSILDYIDIVGNEFLNSIPSFLRAYIPIDQTLPIDEQVKKLRSLNNDEFNELLINHKIDSQTLSRPWTQLTLDDNLIRNNKANVDQWRLTLRSFPLVALQLWCDYFWERIIFLKRPDFLDEVEVVNEIIDGIIHHDSFLLYCIPLWGRLLQKSPNREMELRKAFLKASTGVIIGSTWHFPEFHTFKLKLPLDAILLPHLLSSLIDQFDLLSREGDAGKQPEEKQLSGYGKLIYGFVNNASLLEKISERSDLSQEVRAASLIMFLLHPKGNKRFKRKHRLLIKLYSQEIGFWYLEAIKICLTLLSNEEDSAARSVMGYLLDMTRADYERRQQLQQLLALWRESSYAPVQKSNLQTKWLSGKEHSKRNSSSGNQRRR
jgi:hypothetical protein